MQSISRRLLFVLGAAAFPLAKAGMAQDASGEASTSSPPFCKKSFTIGKWSFERELGNKNNFGAHEINDRIRLEDPDDAYLRSMDLQLSGYSGDYKGAKLILRFGGSIDPPVPFGLLLVGLQGVMFDQVPVPVSKVDQTIHYQEVESAEGVLFNGWLSQSSLDLSGEAATAFLQAMDSGKELQMLLNVPTTLHQGYEMGASVLNLQELAGFQSQLDEIQAQLAADHEQKQCRLAPSKGCFLTTACCDAIGLSDTCFELRTLRRFRDDWLMERADGKRDVENYYRTAPALTDRLTSHPERDRIARWLYVSYILPSVGLILLRRRHAAWRRYCAMMEALESVLSGRRAMQEV